MNFNASLCLDSNQNRKAILRRLQSTEERRNGPATAPRRLRRADASSESPRPPAKRGASAGLTLRSAKSRSNLGDSKNSGPSSSTPQLPFKEPQIPSNADHKALNGGPLGGVGLRSPDNNDHNLLGSTLRPPMLETPTWRSRASYTRLLKNIREKSVYVLGFMVT